MLRSFRLGNHRSFRGEQELLLMPSYDKDTLAVPVAAIYGANASGKSNLIDGLRFMASAVRDSFARWDADGGVPRRPFRLDPAARAEPSTFVAELVIADVRYTYGFVVDDSEVLEEWLYSYPEKRKRVLFEREQDEVKFGSTVPELRTKLEVLAGLLRPSALFVSLAAQSKLESVLPVYHWFVRDVSFGGLGRSASGNIARFVAGNQAKLDQICDLLRAADLGISGLTVDPHPDETAMTDFLRTLVQLRKAVSPEGLVRLLHGDSGEKFAEEEESAGTRSWLGMLPTVLTTLEEGGVLIFDEIDTSLHPALVLRLVKLFHDAETNPAGAQLIFTTHDATLLHPPLAEEALARDEIWFVEKDRTGASTLYPLTDFKPRAEDNLERRYLAGKYGAIPNVLEEDFIAAIRGNSDVET